MKRMLATIATGALLATGSAVPAPAQGQTPFIGQTMIVGFTFCPRGWVEAAGQLLAIASNTALFSLYGTTFGGDGKTTFALPDLRGRIPIQVGQGPGLPAYVLGQASGTATPTLTLSQLPTHNHTMMGTTSAASLNSPANNIFGVFASGGIYDTNGPTNQTMNTSAIASTGGNQPFNNRMPYITLRYCIATQGLFPQRP
jgi:microcystin-dependent protein